MPTLPLARRVHALGTLRYGPGSWYATIDTLRVLLRMVWDRETAHPSVAASWSAEHPELGQSDVTSYFLCVHVFGGTIACNRLADGEMHYVVWEPNGEGATTRDL